MQLVLVFADITRTDLGPQSHPNWLRTIGMFVEPTQLADGGLLEPAESLLLSAVGQDRDQRFSAQSRAWRPVEEIAPKLPQCFSIHGRQLS